MRGEFRIDNYLLQFAIEETGCVVGSLKDCEKDVRRHRQLCDKKSCGPTGWVRHSDFSKIRPRCAIYMPSSFSKFVNYRGHATAFLKLHKTQIR